MPTPLIFILFEAGSWLARHFAASIHAGDWNLSLLLWLLTLPWKARLQLGVTQFVVVLYLLFWGLRIRGCFRRWRQPLLRGPEWFFNVRVEPGFYKGAGRKILRGYWMRMFIPFVLDIPVAIAIFLSGRIQLLNLLILILCAVIHVNHVFSVALAERQARRFAVAEVEEPASSVALSLEPRRLRDYTNFTFEWALAVPSLLALAWLARVYFAAPELRDPRSVFLVPLYCAYMQFGFLFAKRIVLAWRAPAPQSLAAEYLKVREKARKFYLLQCDIGRAVITAQLVLWPFELNASPAETASLLRAWFAAILVFAAITAIWTEIKRKELAALAAQTKPVKLPDLLRECEIARWPVCYQPAAPMLVLKGAYGYSLNLANALAYVGAAYLAGFVGLASLLNAGH